MTPEEAAELERFKARLASEDDFLRTWVGLHQVVFTVRDSGLPSSEASYAVVKNAEGTWFLIHEEDGLFDSAFTIGAEPLWNLARQVAAQRLPDP